MLAVLAQNAVDPIQTVTLDAFLVLVVVSFLIPLATGLLTKLSASPSVKQIVTLVLASVAGIVTTNQQADGTAIISKETAMYAVLSLGIAITSYLGIYQPHNTNAKLAPNLGLG